MKKTKKLLACLIAAATMLTMGSTVFAADAGTTYTDQSTVTIKKAYKLTNEGTTSPAETFTLVQVGDGTVRDSEATSAPHLEQSQVLHLLSKQRLLMEHLERLQLHCLLMNMLVFMSTH